MKTTNMHLIYTKPNRMLDWIVNQRNLLDMNEIDRIALRRKPIGDSALELLVTLRDKNVVLYEGIIEGVQPFKRSSLNFKFLNCDEFYNQENLVNPYVIRRLDEILTALEKREYVSGVNLSYWLAENSDRIDSSKLKKIKCAVGTVLGYNDYNIYEITQDGLDALKEMAEDRLIITKNLSDDWAELGGVRRIYQVVKETANKYIVSTLQHERRNINNGYYYGGDQAIEEVIQVEGEEYYIVPKDWVAVHYASLEQFFTLIEQTQALDVVLRADEEDMEKELAPVLEKYNALSKQRMDRLNLIVEQSDQSSTAIKAQALQAIEGFVLGEDEIDKELSANQLKI